MRSSFVPEKELMMLRGLYPVKPKDEDTVFCPFSFYDADRIDSELFMLFLTQKKRIAPFFTYVRHFISSEQSFADRGTEINCGGFRPQNPAAKAHRHKAIRFQKGNLLF